MDLEFLRKFIPYGEMAVIEENPGAYKDGLERLERHLRSLPTPEDILGKKPEELKIGAHYFGGSSDWWIYALELDGAYGEAFVCLNGDSWNAETGPVYIPELLPIGMINIDLHWKAETTLKDVMDKVRKGSE